MTEQEREELIEKMARAAWESDGTKWDKRYNILLETYLREARAALAVAEPVIREQAENALREENARLREILGDVSRGVQMYRTDINIAAVWLPAIQAVNQYFRDSDETTAIREGEA